MPRTIQLDSDDSDNEPVVKEEIVPQSTESPKNKVILLSSTRVDTGGKKATQREARRRMMERKKRRKSALDSSDDDVEYESASSSSSSDGGLAPIFSARRNEKRRKKKRKKKEDKAFMQAQLDNQMKMQKNTTNYEKFGEELLEEDLEKPSNEGNENEMDDFIVDESSEEENYRGGPKYGDDTDEGEDLFDSDGSSDLEVGVIEEVSAPKKKGKRRDRSDNNESESDDSSVVVKKKNNNNKEKRHKNTVRRSSMKSSSSKTRTEAYAMSDDDDFINDDSDISEESDAVPFSHAAFDAKMMRDEADNEDILAVFKKNKKMDRREAFDIWFKDLVYQCDGYLSGKKYKRVNAAKNAFKAIESVINTHRESTFASMAWKKEFYEELTRRPVFSCFVTPGYGEENCQICGRASHSIELCVQLSGPPYDNFETQKFDCDWDKACSYKKVPTWSYEKDPNKLDSDSDSGSDSDDDDDEDKPIEPTTWNAGEQCAGRSQAYHKLTHFKFKVFDGIKQRLLGETDSLEKRAAKATNGSTIDEFFSKEGEKKKNRGAGGKTPQEILKRDKRFLDDMFMLYTSLIDEAGGKHLSGGRSNSHKLDRLARNLNL
mmetsp:Transcript_15370/g.31668  ORF Transcript_15370/g.31668 Transcript_15370/m.31668 type:complete len:602 (+) Transcript_15370:140-1945(+)